MIQEANSKRPFPAPNAVQQSRCLPQSTRGAFRVQHFLCASYGFQQPAARELKEIKSEFSK